MIIANTGGIVFVLFFLWKRLKEDYHFERVFNLGLYVLAGTIIGGYLGFNYFKDYWFWLAVISTLIGYLLGRHRQKINFFESFEALIIGLLGWVSLVYISDSINNASLYSFLAFWVSLCLLVFFFYLNAHYRKFAWYKSGKVGFAGVVVGFVYFLIRSMVSVSGFSVVSFAASFEYLFSGLTAVIFMILLYRLSRL